MNERPTLIRRCGRRSGLSRSVRGTAFQHWLVERPEQKVVHVVACADERVRDSAGFDLLLDGAFGVHMRHHAQTMCGE